jgi:NAD(P) transhydrogenase subunit alpha
MSPTMTAVYVFVLACFVGYHVVWGVTPALHTPLMAVTNAISAIVVVGAILVAGSGLEVSGSGSPWIQGIGFLAVFLASINIFGGFVVTNRMLAMFKKKK